MDHRIALICAILAFSSSACWSGYAYPADPPGFQRGGPWGSGFGYSTNAANDQTFGRIVHTPNGPTAPVPGKPTKMPASYRFAANAPKFAARIIFMHPGVRTAAGILAWLGMAKIIWDEASQSWRYEQIGTGDNVSTGFDYRVGDNGNWSTTQTGACQAYVNRVKQAEPNNEIVMLGASDLVCRYKNQWTGEQGAGVNINQRQGSCPAGWYQTQGGLCTQTPQQQPLTQEQFEEALEPHPMPETVPKELPYPSPLPIEPIPWINPEPGPNPQTRPRFVPNGDPVKNPDYDPSAPPSPQNQPYIQPGTRINPSPTDKDPFRLDIQPVDRPTPSPDPQPEEDEGPGQNEGDKKPETTGLCEQYPDIVACAKMDDVKPDEVNNEDKTLVIKPEQGWGNENASCPAPVTKQVAGLSLEMSWQPFCDFATGIRPVVIAMAWLSAVLLVLGIARKES